MMNDDGIKKWLKRESGVGLLLITLCVYLICKGLFPGKGWVDLLFGAMILFEIISLVFLEIKDGVKSYGWKHEAIDTLIGVAFALALWFGAQFLLGTNTPISAVVSCSMLDELHRGDFVIVRGGVINTPEVNITREEYDSMVNGPFILNYDGKTGTYSNPLNRYCNQSYETMQLLYHPGTGFTETAGPATYHYRWCDKFERVNKTQDKILCLDYVEIKGQKFTMGNRSNSIIVYSPRRSDLYALVGDIVHRTVVRLNVDGQKYYLTGGDNNPNLDNTVYDCRYVLGNQPVPEYNVKGRVISTVPYLGYLKLFIAAHWNEDPQCTWNLKR